MRNTYTNRIKELREAKNIKQVELAKLLNTTQQAISKWENSERQPDYLILKKLAIIFDVSIDFLLCLENEDGSRNYEDIDIDIEYKDSTMYLKHRETKKKY